jgi:hypothetical protein
MMGKMKELALELGIDPMITEDQRDVAVRALESIANRLNTVTGLRDSLDSIDLEKIFDHMSGAIAASLFIVHSTLDAVKRMEELA